MVMIEKCNVKKMFMHEILAVRL